MRDPLSRNFFKRPPLFHRGQTMKWNEPQAAEGPTTSTLLPPALRKEKRPAPSWAQSGVRHEANTARVLTYSHGDITPDRNLKSMADDLLSSISIETAGKIARRPLFFICHSIGGLVVKLALSQASRSSKYRFILDDCYGVTFFATPHRGSSYLSINDFGVSIQQLLHLSAPLTPKLRAELKLDHPSLLKIDDDFKQLSREFQVWSFHETEDSSLSRVGFAGPTDIPFKTPITSMRSAILGVRHEKVYALQSTHANCASFGTKNAQTLRLYLSDLGTAIQKAEELNRSTTHVPLRLEQRVMIEVHGFYESSSVQESPSDTGIRLVSTRYNSLEAFWEEGPDRLLEKRLNDIRSESQNSPSDAQFVFHRGRARSLRPPGKTTKNTDEHQSKAERSSMICVPPGLSSMESEASLTGLPRRTSFAQEPTVTKTCDGDKRSSDAQPSSTQVAAHPDSFFTGNAGNVSAGFLLPQQEQISSTSRSTTTSETLRPQIPCGTGPLHPQLIPRAPSQRTIRQYFKPIGSTGKYRGGGETTFTQDSKIDPAVANFSSKTCKFVWIHVPFNNPAWVKKVFDTLSVNERQDYSELFSSEHWGSRQERARHARYHASFLKTTCGYVDLNPKQPSMLRNAASSTGGLYRTDSSSPRQGCLYLYFPFLHFDSYKILVKRRDIIKRRIAQGRTRPVPPEVAKKTSLESRVIWEYLGHDPPFNCRRTLDQYRYPYLQDTRARDDDQMLYKMTREIVYCNGKPAVASPGPVLKGGERTPTTFEHGYATGFEDEDEYREHLDSESDSSEDELDVKPEDDVLDGNVLMVDQLWLWAVDSSKYFLCDTLSNRNQRLALETLVTFFPSRESNPMEGPLHRQADLRDSVFNEINDDMTRPCENALDLAALTVLHAVSALLERSSHPDLKIFRIFEEVISLLTELMTMSLKRFGTTGFRVKYSEDYYKLRSSSIRAQQMREDEEAGKDNRDNASALLDLQDIENELATLNNLFEEQEEQINRMMAIYSGIRQSSSLSTSSKLWPTSKKITANSPPESSNTDTPFITRPPLTNNGRTFLQEALTRLKSYRTQTTDMILRVQESRRDFEKMLETILALRQAQIDEVRLARQQADLASAQNRSVMIFTVFTVIFLPLSFFTSLFGMNTQEWGGGNNISLRTIGLIGVPASFILVTSALFVAWSTSARKVFRSLSKMVRRTKNWTRQWWNTWVVRLWKRRNDRPRTRLGRLKMRQKREALEVKRQMIKRETGTHDFWERHLAEKENYEIPSRNRKSISLVRAKAKARKEEKERRDAK